MNKFIKSCARILGILIAFAVGIFLAGPVLWVAVMGALSVWKLMLTGSI